MIKPIIFTITILSGYLHSIAQDSSALIAERTLRIDPAMTNSVPASLVLESVNFIPLETNKESLFGDIHQLLVTDHYIIVRDKDTHSILLFLKNGKFHCKIKRDANSESSIALNGDKTGIQFWDGKEIVMYDMNGKKTGSVHPRYNGSAFYFKDGIIAYSSYSVNENNPDKTDHQLFLSWPDGKFTGFLPYNIKTAAIKGIDYWVPEHPLFYETGTDSVVYFCRPYDYSIYRLSTVGLRKAFSFIFPSNNSLPGNFFTDTAMGNKRLEHAQKHPDQIFALSSPFQIGDILFFDTNLYGNPGYSFLLNLRSENLVSIRYIQPDKLTSYLPITDMDYGVSFMNMNFMTTDGEYVYTSLSSALLFKLKDELADRKSAFSPVLKTYFSKGSRKDNPVIVQIKPKQNF